MAVLCLTGVDMRLTEFNVLLEAAGRYYTIGDSHAVAVATAGGKDWTNLAIGGKPSTDTSMLAKIAQVPKGAIVLVSQGANDTANAMRAYIDSKGKRPLKDPKVIASTVKNVVDSVQAQGAKVIFLLFPNGPGRGAGLAKYYGGDYQEEVRNAIRSALNVPIIDLNGKPLTDGVHATMASYKEVANQVRNTSGTAPAKPTPATAPAQQSQADTQEPELSDVLSGMVKNWLSGGKTPILPAGIGTAVAGQAAADPAKMAAAVNAKKTGQATKPTTGSTASKDSKVTKNSVDPSSIRSYILSKGLSRNHAAGMISNIRAESGFNSAAYNPDDLGARSIGFFQHRAGRADNLERAVPNWRTNWKGQIDFALSEPAGAKYASLRFRTPEAASRWFTINFERPANTVAVADIRAKQAPRYA